MSTSDLARRAWTEDDKRLLIDYWESLGSILLISLLLDRPEGSVQTEASRLNLPRRMEDRGHHRKKWSEDQLAAMRTAANTFQTTDGRIKIIDVANAINRSVDAVANRLVQDYGSREELRQSIYIPRDIREIKMRMARINGGDNLKAKVTDPRKLTKMRKCLCCEKPFWSEGAHNRICPRCKADNDGGWD